MQRAVTQPSATRGQLHRVVGRHPLAAYFVLACAVSWAWWVPMALTGAVARPGVGWPTHLPGLLGPALAALLVTALTDGRSGVAALLRRLTRWRVRWWLWATVLSTAALAYVGVLALAVIGRPLPPVTDFGLYTGIGQVGLAGVAAIALVVNGFGEETGWRGFAADRLVRNHSPLTTALLVAGMWALWHVPVFWIVQSFRAFGPAGVLGWLVGLTAGSLVLTFLYVRSRHSVLLVAAWHTAFNLASATAATTGLVAAISSTVVMSAAIVIAVAWLVRRRRDGTRHHGTNASSHSGAA